MTNQKRRYKNLKISITTSKSSYKVGDPVRLECDFEEGRDQLYSVKWYKDNMEFYRSDLTPLTSDV